MRRVGLGLILTILFCSVNASSLKAQSYLQAIGQPPFSTTLPIKDGFINAGNGDVHLEIPLGSFAQRGGRTDKISLMYDSDIWGPVGTSSRAWAPSNVGSTAPAQTPGWRLATSQGPGAASSGFQITWCGTFPILSKYTPWTWTASDGTQHSFPVATAQDNDPGDPYCPPYTSTPNAAGYANDGSGYYISITNYKDATIYAPDGTVYHPNGTVTYGGTSTSTTTDPNGNQYTEAVTYAANGAITDVKYIDTVGRTLVDITESSDGNTLYYAIPKPGGGTNTYTVKLETVAANTNFGQPYVSEYSGTFQAISEIDLPDGSAYHFTYDSGTGSGHYGLLTTMTLPTEGTIWYAYNNFTDAYGNKSRWIYSQTIPGSSVPWTYQPLVISTCAKDYVNCEQQIEVTAPSSDTTYYYFDLNAEPYLTEVVRYASPGSAVGYTYACYNFVSSNNGTCSYPYTPGTGATNVYETWQIDGIGNESKTTEYAWDPANNGNLDTLSEWDFGSSAQINPPDRTTTTTYYKNGYVIDKPATITIKDKNGNQVSQTTNGYDENNGSPQCACGNLTSVTQWLNTGGSNPKTQYVYNGYGMVTKKADPNDPTIANPTIYTYDSTGVYLSSIQYPTPSDGVQQIESFSYDASTGVINWAKNRNGNETSYAYDSIGRLSQTNYPDGGQSTFSYPSANEVDFTKKVTSSTNETGSSLVDGLGRLSRTLVSNGESTPYDEADTCYDVDGRLSYKSYPYQSTGQYVPSCTEPGDTFAYDGLDRTTSVTHSDNSRISVSYSNNCETTTDEAGKTRETCTDAEGHITEVIENPGGLNYTTNYTYDPLGNLTTVVQSGSRNRTFGYDSLSRLISSDNPETNASGPATSYTYDANGNLTSRTDARSITTSYAYDALNRIAQKSYSDTTPGVTYTYDQPACLGEPSCSNIGRRTSMSGAAGSTEWAYDSMGRTLVEQRTTNSLTKSAVYAYNFLGAPTSIQYPSGRTIDYTYNAGDRPFSATDATTGVNYADVIHYAATGAPCWQDYGDAITAAETLNSLQQPSKIQATSGIVTYSGGGCPGLGQVGNLIDLSYNFGPGQDNGDVVGISNNIDSTRSQAFAYDALNRVTTGETTSTYSTSPAHCWGESYQYDNQTSGGAFGNLTAIGVASSSYNGCAQENLSVTGTTQNQLGGFSYDAAGDMLSDGVNNYAYDAEGRICSVGGSNCSAGTLYIYDGSGQRVEKSDGTLYWYGVDGNVLDQTDLSGNVTSEYVYLGSRRIARISSSSPTNIPIQNALFQSTSGTLGSGQYNFGPIPDWAITGSETGSWYPTSSYFSSVPNGNIVAFANSGGTISQTLTGTSLQPNSTYTLSAYIGNRADGISGDYSVQLEAGSTVLATLSGAASAIPSGTFAQKELTYTTGGSAPSGNLGIVLSNTSNTQSDFNGVQLTLEGSQTIDYYLQDGLGTTRVMADSSGTLCYDADFYPFGGERPPYTDSCPQNYKFTGKERDADSLDYFPARYGSSQLGRFMSPDPVGDSVANPANPQSWNLYSYVTNNPLSMVDPTGTDECFLPPPPDTGHAGTGPSPPPTNETACIKAHGTWVKTDQTVYATAPLDYYAPAIISPQWQSVTTPKSLLPLANLRSQSPTGTFLSCATSGNVLKASAETGLDVFGAIPVAGNIAHGLQLGAGFISAGFSLSGSFTDAAVSGGSLGLSIADTEKLTSNIALHGTELVPIFGNVVSGISAVNDVVGKEGVISSLKACRNGTN